jgi:hypothetical protein
MRDLGFRYAFGKFETRKSPADALGLIGTETVETACRGE